MKDEIDSSFAIFHNNILSINRNLEKLQIHVMDELDFHFSIIVVSETKITNSDLACRPTMPGCEFEYINFHISCLWKCWNVYWWNSEV